MAGAGLIFLFIPGQYWLLIYFWLLVSRCRKCLQFDFWWNMHNMTFMLVSASAVLLFSGSVSQSVSRAGGQSVGQIGSQLVGQSVIVCIRSVAKWITMSQKSALYKLNIVKVSQLFITHMVIIRLLVYGVSWYVGSPSCYIIWCLQLLKRNQWMYQV